jgi:hypothetical protein
MDRSEFSKTLGLVFFRLFCRINKIGDIKTAGVRHAQRARISGWPSLSETFQQSSQSKTETMKTIHKNGVTIADDTGFSGNDSQPFVIELPEPLTAGILLEILSQVPPGTKIICDLNELDSKSFPMTCLRYDGKRLVEITIGH